MFDTSEYYGGTYPSPSEEEFDNNQDDFEEDLYEELKLKEMEENDNE